VSMKQAASDLGMTEQSLHKLIKANSTKIDTLLTIAAYFKVEPAYFFDFHSDDTNQYVKIKREELIGLIKKVLAYSIHGFGLIKLEWDDKEEKFNSYFDILDKLLTFFLRLHFFDTVIVSRSKVKLVFCYQKSGDIFRSSVIHYFYFCFKDRGNIFQIFTCRSI
jgi:transcriptional regulator with XRE-family HTH domain